MRFWLQRDHSDERKRDIAMAIFQRVPYEPDPSAVPYHDAHNYASTKSAKYPAKFAVFYVEHCVGRMPVPEAWESAPEDVKT